MGLHSIGRHRRATYPGRRAGYATTLTAMAMAGALPVAFASPTDPADSEGAAGSAVTTPPEGEPSAPEAPEGSQAPEGSEAPEGGNDGGSNMSGYAPNGSAAGLVKFTPMAPSEAHPFPDPPKNTKLPEEVDVKAPFRQQVSCDPEDRPGVTAFAMLMTETYDRQGWSGARTCIDYASFHHEGRALDWSLDANNPADRVIADNMLAWLTENDGEMAARFGIEYAIWNGMIWMADNNEWRAYTGSAHADHIHFSFTWDGAQMRTSWWTGVAVQEPDYGPCPTEGEEYAAVHQAPRLTPCGAGEVPSFPADETPMTTQSLNGAAESDVDAPGESAQARENKDGSLPFADWQKTEVTERARTVLTEGDSGEDVKVLQEIIGAEADGEFGPQTVEKLTEFEEQHQVLEIQASRQGRAAGEPAVVTPLTWTLLERELHPTIELRDIRLSYGDVDAVNDEEDAEAAQAVENFRQTVAQSTGDELRPFAGGAVTALQRLLDLETDGQFGHKTTEAVEDLQAEAGLPVTGVVDGPTWAAAEERAAERSASKDKASDGDSDS